MNVFKLIFKEVLHRKLNFLLSIAGIMGAVAIVISFFTTGEASKKETIRLMRDMGYNLRIIPKDERMEDFWMNGYSDLSMPESYLKEFESQKGISYAHVLATLQRKIDWRGGSAILTGISSEVARGGKSAMIFEIAPGKVFLGYELAKREGLKDGAQIDVLGKPVTIEKCLSESGSIDDLRIYARLDEVQSLTGMAGRINEIKALECDCQDPHMDVLALLRDQLSKFLPEAKVIRMEGISEARERQRNMVDTYFALLMPAVIALCALWVASLAMLNTRERRGEIGILRALGYGSGTVAALFLGKAIIVGVIGSVGGFALGTGFAMKFGPELFRVTEGIVRPDYSLLAMALIAAPLFAAISAFLPAMVAVTQDPAESLRCE